MTLPTHKATPDAGAAQVDEEYALPCAEALLAGALALMTAHAQGCCDNHREVIAQKVVANLFMLSQHPTLTPDFRALVWSLHSRWVQQAQHALAGAAAESTTMAAQPREEEQALWHRSPEAVQ